MNAKGLEDDTPLHDASSNGHIKVKPIYYQCSYFYLSIWRKIQLCCKLENGNGDNVHDAIDFTFGFHHHEILKYCIITSL